MSHSCRFTAIITTVTWVQQMADSARWHTIIGSVVLTLHMVRLLGALRFHPHMAVLVNTLVRCATRLQPFIIMYAVMLLGMTLVGMALFGHAIAAFSSAGGALCATWTFGNNGDLHTAHMDVSDRFVDCLAHEFMHVLGIDNHWNGAFASPGIKTVLAPRGRPGRTIDFSDWDEMAIRLLYHPDVRPGMRRTAAMRVMRRLLAENAVARPTGRPT